MLQLSNLSLQLGDFYLSPLSAVFEKKSYTILLGPCGSGKTKLLELIAGIRTPLSGSISWDNQNIHHLPPEKRKIGLMYQNPFLFPHLSVKDNILYGVRYQNSPNLDTHQRLQELVSLLKLENLISRKDVTHLSGGEKQKIALARCLILNPEILLLDEPSASLDIQAREELYWLLRHLNKEKNLTVIHVTHHLNEAIQLAGKCLILLNGKLSAQGNLNKILKSPPCVETAHFLGYRNIYNSESNRNLKPLFIENKIPFPENSSFFLSETKLNLVTSIKPEIIFLESIRQEDGVLLKTIYKQEIIYIKCKKFPSSILFSETPEKFTFEIPPSAVKIFSEENTGETL